MPIWLDRTAASARAMRFGVRLFVCSLALLAAVGGPGFVPPAAGQGAGSVIVNEIMQKPVAVNDSEGEWFELYNPGSTSIDINGWTITDERRDSHTIVNGGPLMIPAGGYLVLGNNGDLGTNGGVPIDYVVSGIALSNRRDKLILLNGGLEIDRVEYDGGPVFPDPTGASMALIDPLFDNNVGGNWCTSTTPFGDGDLGTPGAANDCTSGPGSPAEAVINEIMQNPAAASDGSGEWFELYNPGSTGIDIDGWTITDERRDSHTIVNGGPLMVPAGGYLVLGNNGDSSTNGGVTVDYVYSSFFLGNRADKIVLLDDLDEERDRVEWDGGPTFPAPNGASMELSDPVLDNNDGANWCESSTMMGTGDMGTPGAENDCQGGPPGGGNGLEIFEIQGAGLASPHNGAIVTTNNNVVTAVSPDGFFMQTPAARSDNDVDTSDGIFVYTSSAPAVSVGDLVNVEARVQEFFNFTELTSATVSVSSPGGGILPPPVVFSDTLPSPDPTVSNCAIEYECWEGMLVEVPAGVVGSGNQGFGSDPLAEVFIVAGSERSFREPGIEFPGLPGPLVWDGNPEVFELDPDKAGLANEIIPGGSTFSAVGVLGFEFGGYELWPTDLSFSPAILAAPVRDEQAGEYTIGTLNLFRLFDDVNDPGSQDNGQVVSPAVYSARLAKFSMYIRSLMRSPDILGVQEAEKLGVLQDLAAQIAADDPSVQYNAYLVEGNDIGGIDVGFLVRDHVFVESIEQLGAGETLSVDGSLLHDRPPLLLRARPDGDPGGEEISVIVVHNRSLSGIEDPGDGSRVRQKRLEQAQSIAAKVQQMQNAGDAVVIIGDFNGFEFSDGYVDVVGQIMGDFEPSENLLFGPDLVMPDLTNAIDWLAASERYSYVFRGSAQVLDHALVTSDLSSRIRGVGFARGNADAAEIFEFDDTTPVRSSDHDGLVLFLSSGGPGRN